MRKVVLHELKIVPGLVGGFVVLLGIIMCVEGVVWEGIRCGWPDLMAAFKEKDARIRDQTTPSDPRDPTHGCKRCVRRQLGSGGAGRGGLCVGLGLKKKEEGLVAADCENVVFVGLPVMVILGPRPAPRPRPFQAPDCVNAICLDVWVGTQNFPKGPGLGQKNELAMRESASRPRRWSASFWLGTCCSENALVFVCLVSVRHRRPCV